MLAVCLLAIIAHVLTHLSLSCYGWPISLSVVQIPDCVFESRNTGVKVGSNENSKTGQQGDVSDNTMELIILIKLDAHFFFFLIISSISFKTQSRKGHG